MTEPYESTGDSVRRAVEALLEAKGGFSSRDLVAQTSLTRQALHGYLQDLVSSGRIERRGSGRGAYYVRGRTRLTFASEHADEAAIWEETRQRAGATGWPTNVADTHQYVLTEIANNAIDHSGSRTISVAFWADSRSTEFEVRDQGIGAFEKVRQHLGLGSAVEAIWEVAKGKTTTDPERHTGEGLFFSSKAVDTFTIAANGFEWVVDNLRSDYAIRAVPDEAGTAVRWLLALDSPRSLPNLFAQYTEEYEFATTSIAVKLFEYGARFVSRSEAKRLLDGLDRFEHVILDFAGVEMVGQGFADEAFRVWPSQHPGTSVEPRNATAPGVALMVRRAIRRPGA